MLLGVFPNSEIRSAARVLPTGRSSDVDIGERADRDPVSAREEYDVNETYDRHRLLWTIHGGHQLWEMVIRKCGACIMTNRDELGI